jgi:hypothetical protein
MVRGSNPCSGSAIFFPRKKKGRFRCRQRVFFRNRFFPIGKNPFFSFRKKPDKFKSVYRVFFPFLKKTRTTLYYTVYVEKGSIPAEYSIASV